MAMLTSQVLTQPVLAVEDIYELTFPVAGENHYSDTFGAPRSGGRTHAGTDIIADKMVPVVAAASGTIGRMHNEQGGNCCGMALNHDDGWASWYIHMNNDTPGTDDGLGWGFADGIESGVHVEEGQLLGWVGDSGNAEWTTSHLHFELRDPSGAPVNSYPSLIAAQSPGLQRLAGSDRYETAALISEAHFDDSVERVVIASGRGFADALAAAPLAGTLGIPILLVDTTTIPNSTMRELKRIAPIEVIVVGGDAVVGTQVEDALIGLGVSVTRLAGLDRYGTAAAISRHGYREAATVFLASGAGFADALAGAGVAGATGSPLLLTLPSSLPPPIARELHRLAPERVVLLGGTGALTSGLEGAIEQLLPNVAIERWGGATRYGTAAVAAHIAMPSAEKVFIATGDTYADALAGAPVAAVVGAPILLVGSTLPAATEDAIVALRPTEIVLLGGSGAVSSAVEVSLAALVRR